MAISDDNALTAFARNLKSYLEAKGGVRALAKQLLPLLPQAPDVRSKYAANEDGVIAAIRRWQKGQMPDRMYSWALSKATEGASDTWNEGQVPVGTEIARSTSTRAPLKSRIEHRAEVVDDDNDLRDEYPSDYEERLSAAKSLLITGLSLRRLGVLSDADFVRQHKFEALVRDIVLTRKGTVQVIMLDPDTPACRYGWIQDYWTNKGKAEKDFADYQSDVRRTLNIFREIQQSINRELRRVKGKKGEFLFYQIDYMLSCGLDIVDAVPPAKHNPIAFVRYYPLASRLVGEDWPILRLARSENRRWFKFYFDQFQLHLDLAKDHERRKAAIKRHRSTSVANSDKSRQRRS